MLPFLLLSIPDNSLSLLSDILFMNNVKSVMNYFDGNFLFNLYLKNIIGNTNDESYMYEDNLLNDINKNAVIMGCICNIMTSIKAVSYTHLTLPTT